ncbi:MAG: hypothetical protein ACHQAY_00735 [Hyphomicrobiales bacterium]
MNHVRTPEYRLRLNRQAPRDRTTSIEFGKAYGFTEKPSAGEIYNYRFATKELKEPLQKAVVANGWRWRPVAFGKL